MHADAEQPAIRLLGSVVIPTQQGDPQPPPSLPAVRAQDGETFSLPIDDVDLLTYSVAVGSIVDVSLKGGRGYWQGCACTGACLRMARAADHAAGSPAVLHGLRPWHGAALLRSLHACKAHSPRPPAAH